MVFYYLLTQTGELIEYEYYPENRKEKKPGVITIDVIKETIRVTVPAEGDGEYHAEEFNERWWYYGNHALHKIRDDYNSGVVKDWGMVAWY